MSMRFVKLSMDEESDAAPECRPGGALHPASSDLARLWWLDAMGTDAVLLDLIDTSGRAGAGGPRGNEHDSSPRDGRRPVGPDHAVRAGGRREA